MPESSPSEKGMTEWPAEPLYLCSTSTAASTMEPCLQLEGISEGSSSSNDSLAPGGQCWEELWMPNLQPTASHNAGGPTQSDDPDALRHVHTNSLEDTSSDFNTAITSISLHETKDASPATLAHSLASFESDDFEMWLKAFGASPNVEYGMIEPESSEIPLFPAGEIDPMFSGNSIGEDHYYTDAVVHNHLPSSYLCLANNTPYVTNIKSPSAPEPLLSTSDFDGIEGSNGSEMRHQLVRKLAPAAEAQFMTRRKQTINNEHLVVPAIKPRQKRQCFDPLKREKVKQFRRLGACLRCRIYKEPCDQDTLCTRCLQEAENVRLFKQPCYRESLDNVVPFRLGCASLGQVRAVQPTFTWSTEEPTIKVLQFLCGVLPSENSPILTFECRRFVPATGDKIDLELRTGDTVTIVKRPPYAIYDIEKAFKSTEAFLNDGQPAMEAIISETNPDKILALTLAEANRYSTQYDNHLIRIVLKVRKFAARCLHVQDPEFAFPTPIVNDQNSKRCRRSTCPPYINYQLDYMINQLIDRHRKTVLKGLKSLIFGGKKMHRWYEAFLLIYLLLSTLEFAYQHQLDYAAETVGTSTYGDVDYVTRTYLAEWEYSAGILITHFKCILRGQIPFLQSQEEASKSHARTGLDAQSIEYLQKITVIAKDRNLETTARRVPDENEYRFRGLGSWTSLLFLDN